MPREFVVTQPPAFLDEQGREHHDEREGVVSIGWQKETEQVQLATYARAQITHDTIWDGYYVDLNRSQINDVIRKLRKARDQAFGRDE